jgi:predicted enzyme related to lactoylglutathione lyase
MALRITLTSLLVPDYDEALLFFTRGLGWLCREDTPGPGGKRWLVVGPPGGGAGLLLARAANDEQRSLIGRQGAGRVWLFVHCDDFDADLARIEAHGGRRAQAPRTEAYGRVVVFTDPWGNRWDLIEPAADSTPQAPGTILGA